MSWMRCEITGVGVGVLVKVLVCWSGSGCYGVGAGILDKVQVF